ncbi:cupin domain-containing protein [Marivibrio halodurans]|uniref:Cupin domain-containing protein n=1 Tax=Marivibrio halodurans TaxID=2039722 RepID=A0A8J7SJ13_9PROT|nr:cupin domain-containing protein [Marivibrio halodurans]MBP5857408.1 cupin domain-containing protein [Marivibrio halodurans]
MTTKAIDRQRTGSRFVDPGEQAWRETDAPGFLIKPIFEDSRTGESTLLMRIEPGAFTPAHAHDRLEEIFVLDGDFHDEERTYGPGHYCQRAIGASHTAGSKGGCTVLLVYRD